MAEKSPYASIDPIIDGWAVANSLKVFKSFAGREVRSFYVSNSSGECYQVSIQPPHKSKVAIDLWGIETKGDRDMHKNWDADPEDLRKLLDIVLDTAHTWLKGNQPVK